MGRALDLRLLAESYNSVITEGIIDSVIQKLARMGIVVTKADIATSAVVIGGLLSAIASGEAFGIYLKSHPELLKPNIRPIVQKIIERLPQY